MSSDRVFYRVSGTHTNVGTSEETTLQLPAPGGGAGIFMLRSFHYVRSGGSNTHYAPRLGQAASFTNGDINERMVYTSQAVGTPINDVFSSDIPVKTDSNGRLYFRPGFNSGTSSSDNDGDYEFFFEYVRGG